LDRETRGKAAVQVFSCCDLGVYANGAAPEKNKKISNDPFKKTLLPIEILKIE